MVTVVDAANFLDQYAAVESLRERGEALSDDDDRNVVDLLVDQVEFADVIVLNKIDRAAPADLDRLTAILRALNPEAEFVRAEFGRVPLDRLLNTHQFDFERAAQAPGWLRELRGEHVPESEEYGIRSFVYRARRPFHPERFRDLLEQEWPGVLRSKGFFWLATRMEHIGSWSQAGRACRIEPAGFWWAALPEEHWPEEADERAALRADWQEPFGDRRQELVVIGIEVDQAALTAALDACLLTDDEMAAGPEAWADYDDPFGEWQVELTEAEPE
jgi:G3E family GTPase